MMILIFTSIMLIMANEALAQKNNDPTYSIHNYKHPNKAAEAAERNYDNPAKFRYRAVKRTHHRNYKAQNNSATIEGGLIPTRQEKITNSPFSERNYKRQF